jgi:anti-sigma regulatory factor (Ser/Thr protein kinase)
MHELNIEAKPENMDKVLNFINQHIAACPPKICSQIGIVIDEIFSNIARYAYKPDKLSHASSGAAGDAAVRISVDDKIIIEFEDTGLPYNPLENPDPDLTLGAEEREIGGLGLFMVKKIMDTVEYRREGNKNILTLRKNIG